MRASNEGVEINYEVSGEGPPVILLHGFPDTGNLWRHQVAALSTAGYRVITPDLRGYGLSDKPTDVDAYNVLSLAGDVVAVIAGIVIGAIGGFMQIFTTASRYLKNNK